MTDYADLELDPHVLLRGLVETDRALTGVDPESFKAAMRVLAGGVVMVTARVGERLWGLTISACCSISASPPKVLISLSESASCLPAILETKRFGLSILRADQRPLAELGAVPGGPKYVEAFREGRDDEPMIAGALAHLDCSVDRVLDVADHKLVIGTVESVAAPPADRLDEPGPLVYFNRAFHGLGARIP
jgi:flavin reductase ActVB